MSWAGYYGGTWRLLTGLSTVAAIGLLGLQVLRGNALAAGLWGLVAVVSLFLAVYHARRPAIAIEQGMLKLKQGLFRDYVSVPLGQITEARLDEKVLVIRTQTQEMRFKAHWLDEATRQEGLQRVLQGRLEG